MMKSTTNRDEAGIVLLPILRFCYCSHCLALWGSRLFFTRLRPTARRIRPWKAPTVGAFSLSGPIVDKRQVIFRIGYYSCTL